MWSFLVVAIAWSSPIKGFLTVRAPPTKGYETSRTAPFHPAIHNFGNIGFLGRIHAKSARIATFIIDRVAYDGRNMRREVSNMLRLNHSKDARVLEVGCGVGTLTQELLHVGFTNITALDTSGVMIEAARIAVPGPSYLVKNVVDTNIACDVAIVSMVLHEMPQVAHVETIEVLAKCIAFHGEIWLIDIDPNYTPSTSMISGEPYVQDYLENIEETISNVSSKNSLHVRTFSIIPDHVRVWVLSRVSFCNT